MGKARVSLLRSAYFLRFCWVHGPGQARIKPQGVDTCCPQTGEQLSIQEISLLLEGDCRGKRERTHRKEGRQEEGSQIQEETEDLLCT